MWLIISIVIVLGVMWFIGIIGEAIKVKRAKIRDQVAEELFSGLNIDSTIENYKNKLNYICYGETVALIPSEQDVIIPKFSRKMPSDVASLGKCPLCEQGYLRIIDGKYGKFLGCTRYPNCHYTKSYRKTFVEYAENLAIEREEYKKSINEQILNDIRKAYSKI